MIVTFEHLHMSKKGFDEVVYEFNKCNIYNY